MFLFHATDTTAADADEDETSSELWEVLSVLETAAKHKKAGGNKSINSELCCDVVLWFAFYAV